MLSRGTYRYDQEDCQDGDEFLHSYVSALFRRTRVTDVVEALGDHPVAAKTHTYDKGVGFQILLPLTDAPKAPQIDREPTYFDVWGVSMRKGTPSRIEGIAGFAFGGEGSPTWLLIDVEEA
jgi:hypothetical protein